MTRRLFLIFLLSLPLFARANEITIVQNRIINAQEGILLSAHYDFRLPASLEEALTSGIPLFFIAEIEITRPRWYWFDARLINAQQSFRLSYNVLTRQYRVAINDSLAQSFTELSDALAVIKWPRRWLIAPKDTLKPGVTYDAALRLRFDTSQMPKPFQINALNDSDWRLASDWKRFTFKLEAQ